MNTSGNWGKLAPCSHRGANSVLTFIKEMLNPPASALYRWGRTPTVTSPWRSQHDPAIPTAETASHVWAETPTGSQAGWGTASRTSRSAQIPVPSCPPGSSAASTDPPQPKAHKWSFGAADLLSVWPGYHLKDENILPMITRTWRPWNEGFILHTGQQQRVARGTPTLAPTLATVWKSSRMTGHAHSGLWREASSAGSVTPRSLSSPEPGAPNLQPYQVRRLNIPLPLSTLNMWTDPAWFTQNYKLLINQQSINQ